MKIALISDIHGNEAALISVLSHIKKQGVDQIFCLGDVATLGPSPGSVISILKTEKIPCIMGNHDEFLLNENLIHQYTDFPVIKEAVDWCRAQLDEDDLKYISGFSPLIELNEQENTSMLFYHGSPKSNTEDILSTSNPGEFDRYFEGYGHSILAGGHTHIQMLLQHGEKYIVNSGSVGMPFKEYAAGGPPTLLKHAEYAIINLHIDNVEISLKQVEYDLEPLRASILESDNPLCDMLMQQYS